MKFIKYILLILLSCKAVAQSVPAIKPYKVLELYSKFETVEDSLLKIINPANTIIYKTCEGFRSFYFIKEGSYWKGYYLKNLIIDGLIPPSVMDTVGGDVIVGLPSYLTELSVFNADSLYALLVKNKVYDIKQLHDEEVIKAYGKANHVKENEFYALPFSDHDCYATIIIYGMNNKAISYSNDRVGTKELHSIPSIKTFYDVKNILAESCREIGKTN